MNERTQQEERQQIGVVKRDAILNKSNNKCCHCGQLISFDKKKGYNQATVEHFVPLSKGGTNSIKNLIALCPSCNREKDDYIYYPLEYLDFLPNKYILELEDYFEEWLNTCNYVCNNNLLACDKYKIGLSLYGVENNYNWDFNTRNEMLYKTSKFVWFNRALQKDVKKLAEALVKREERIARKDKVKFTNEDKEIIKKVYKNILNIWLEIGTIYYVERPDGIKSIHCAEVYALEPEGVKGISVLNYSMYLKRESILDLVQISQSIPYMILRENDIDFIPIHQTFCDTCVEEDYQLIFKTKNLYNEYIEKRKQPDFDEHMEIFQNDKLLTFFNHFDIEKIKQSYERLEKEQKLREQQLKDRCLW